MVPPSNHEVLASPFGVAIPFNVAVSDVIAVGDWVAEYGAAAWEGEIPLASSPINPHRTFLVSQEKKQEPRDAWGHCAAKCI